MRDKAQELRLLLYLALSATERLSHQIRQTDEEIDRIFAKVRRAIRDIIPLIQA